MTKITRNQVALEEHARSNNLVQPIAGFTREDANNPESWVHVASILRPLDKLSVLPIDKKWYGEYIVIISDGTDFALVETLYRDLAPATGEGASSVNGYDVSWGGPAQRWRVKRLSDDKVMVSGMEKAEAEAWAANGGKPASAAA
jgi:hypothetical protein